jgi:HEAT repeat protein
MRKLFNIVLFIFLIFSFGCPLDDDTAKYLEALKSENITVRKEAVYYLGENKEEDAVPLLIQLLSQDQSKEVRIKAIEALGKIGGIDNNSHVDTLIGILRENDTEILTAAVEALGKIKDPKAVKPLINLLDNRDIRLAAIWALGNVGDKGAVPALTGLLNSDDKYVRHNSTQALKQIGGKE